MALVAATVWLPLSVLTSQPLGWIRAEGPAVWALRLLTLTQLLLGVAWTLRASVRWSQLGRRRHLLIPPGVALGLAVSIVLISWALPSV